MKEDLPSLIRKVRDVLISLMDERLSFLWVYLEVVRLKTYEVTFKGIDAHGVPCFFDGTEPIISMHWITHVESAFSRQLLSDCNYPIS